MHVLYINDCLDLPLTGLRVFMLSVKENGAIDIAIEVNHVYELCYYTCICIQFSS